MRYYCLLTIPVEGSHHFMEVGLEYNLPFHPNLTDEIQLMDYFSKIESIYYTLEDVETGGYATIRLTAIDGIFQAKNGGDEGAIAFLRREWIALRDNYDGIVFNDASAYSDIYSKKSP